MLLCVLAVGCSKPTPSEPAAATASASDFVSVAGTHFRLHDKPYYYVGANLWYGSYLGSPGATGNRTRLVRELDELKSLGVTNIRVLGLSEASALQRAVRPAIITEPGKYDEELLQGLDYFLAELARRDMKAVIYLNNFWQWSGGMSQYVSWFAGKPVMDPDVTGDWNAFMDNSAAFYSLGAAQSAYHDAIRMLITRRNSVTGVAYNEDPTIMAWQLANEPRPGSDANGKDHAQRFIDWIDQTAAYIDSIAPKQLISTGNEGWMGTAGDKDMYLAAHRSAHVDYLTYHMWGPNWSWFDPKNLAATYEAGWRKAQDYLDWHIDAARELGKPVVLEEFGMNRDGGLFSPEQPTQIRDRYYRSIFELLHQRAAAGDPIAGSNFWAWNGAGRRINPDFMWKAGDPFLGDPPQEAQGLYGVFDTDASTLDIIRDAATQMNALNR